MLFEIAAPFYDWFVKKVNMDHSSRIADWLSPVRDRDLLDLGGGTGINAEALAGAGARVTVVDFSRSMLARAKAKGIRASLIRADAADLPLPDGSFDIVLVSDAWHHFRRQGRVIVEIQRLLRCGGRLYIIDFDGRHPRTRILSVLERIAGEPSAFWTPGDLAAAFKSRSIRGDFRILEANQYLYRGVKE